MNLPLTQVVADKNESWLEQHSKAAVAGQDVDWLADLRSQALEDFEQLGLPGVRDEDWRYTNLRSLKSNEFNLNSASESEFEANFDSAADYRLVFVDGNYSQKHSLLPTIDGLIFANLSSVLDQVNNNEAKALDIQPYFGSTIPYEQHGFTALNTAYCQDGYVLHIAKNTVVEGVLEVIYVQSASAADTDSDNSPAMTHTRNLIVAEQSSQCTIVEKYISIDDSAYLHNCVTEIIVNENAHLDHYKIQTESDDAYHVGGVFIQQAANSTVQNHNVALSGLLIRNDIHAQLLGQGSHTELNGLVFGTGNQHVDNHTEVNHAVPNCTSDEFYKTVLDDKSRSVFRGRIIVAEDAQQTNADQQNNNLLLSKNAEADCKPQLEIYADDVKCSHGATVGQIDPTSLFYLQSRGIDKDSANSLLTFAFANEVIERIKVDSIKTELTQHIAGALLSDT